MSVKQILELKAPHHSTDDRELLELLNDAICECDHDGEICHNVYDETGRGVAGLQVLEETLTDGSKVRHIVIKFI